MTMYLRTTLYRLGGRFVTGVIVVIGFGFGFGLPFRRHAERAQNANAGEHYNGKAAEYSGDETFNGCHILWLLVEGFGRDLFNE